MVNAPVRDLELHDGNLYVGGEDITGSTRGPGEPYGPKHVSVINDDTLDVAHRARFVNGTPRTGVALIDIESNTLRN